MIEIAFSKIITDYMEGKRPRYAEVEAALQAEEVTDFAYMGRQAKLQKKSRDRVELIKQNEQDIIFAEERNTLQ